MVDDTADLSLAARELYRGASFDNNLLCLAEKEVFVMDNVADELVDRLVGEGAYLLDESQLTKITKLAMVNKAGNYEVNKNGWERMPVRFRGNRHTRT